MLTRQRLPTPSSPGLLTLLLPPLLLPAAIAAAAALHSFSKVKGSKRATKKPPGFWCDASITKAEMQQHYMACMREPLE